VNARLRGLAGRIPGYPIVKVVIPVTLVAILAAVVLGPAPTPGPSASPGRGAPVAAASPSTGPTEPGPTPTPEPWEDLVLEAAAVLATLTPTHEDRAGVARATSFTLRSLGATAASTLAAGVQTDPPISFRILPGENPEEAVLEPVKPLAEGQTYRLRLIAPDGSLGGSWAFQTQRPLQVVSTVPGAEQAAVPVDTGIEVTFDQDGATAVEAHFRIAPAVNGRFEAHGRTWAFIPDAPLQPATAYRVTVEPGVSIADSDQVLEAGVSFRFETEAKAAARELPVAFAGPMAAIKPGEQPALPLYAELDDEASAPDTLPVRIFRLPDLGATLAAAARLTGPDSWLRASGAGLVPTADLVRVASIDGPLAVDRGYVAVLSIPIRLDSGAYLVVVPRQAGDAQLVLQVRHLAAYVVSTETQTMAWVNDLGSVAPVAGATVAAIDGAVLGITDANGMARFATPSEIRPGPEEGWSARPRIVSITAPGGRWIVAGLGSPISWLDGRYDNNVSLAAEPSNRWWLLMNTDRSMYRQTDTIHAWGLVRSRDEGAAPRRVELRLRPSESDTAVAPIALVAVSLSARGMFAADVPVVDLPRSSYVLELVVDGVTASSRWLNVADIRKPSFQLDVRTDRHAYIDGDPIEVTISAAFFDGATAPGMELRVSPSWDSSPVTVTTDATGGARVTLAAEFEGERPSGWDYHTIHVTPVRPEEGEVSGSSSLVVFPANAWLTGTARLSSTTLVIDGTLSRVNLAGIEASFLTGDWSEDLSGRPIGGRTVSATVTQLVEVRRQVGTSYDYLEKRVVPVYEYDTVRKAVGTSRTQSATDGAFRITLTVPSATDDYAITLRSSDGADRPVEEYPYAGIEGDPNPDQPAYLLPSGCGYTPGIVVALDAQATVTLHDGDGSAADDGRFLFLVADRGLREVTASATSTYSRKLRDADLPGYTVRAVQVTGQGYTTADARVDVELDDVTLGVTLAPDRARYQPGDRVTVAVTTLGPDGQPVAADVVVQGVDEKLYAIGAAEDADVVRELYRRTDPGFLQSFVSHRIPTRRPDGGCGATGGGRDAFGDVATFQLVKTGADGRGSLSFELLDDLTSWHLTAVAVSRGLRVGTASVLVPVSLPFFVESVLAPDYLVGEAPVLRIRGYGDGLEAGDRVRFAVSSPSLGLAETAVEGRAFEAVRVPLPELPLGDHRIRIDGRGPTAGLTDAVIRFVHVVPSRLAGLVTHYDMLVPTFTPEGGNGLTTYTVVDAGRGTMLSLLQELTMTSSARFDRLAAADVARELLIEEFGYAETDLRPSGFDPTRYEQGGIAIVPYASSDPETSALAALIVPDRLAPDSLRSYLGFLAEGDQSTREGRIMALAGLAGLGDDVLSELRALAAEQLTIRESLWLALGLVALGDENGARAIERALLDEHGERFGPWVRLAVGGSLENTLDAARLLLILSARLGEPFARDVARYLADHRPKERAIALELLAYAQAGLDRLPRTAGRFAWTVSGERQEVELEPGGAFTLVLTAPQRETLRLEPLAGELAVVSSWVGGELDVPSGSSASIKRVVTPADDAPDDRLVHVLITVTFGPLATEGCWQITDVAPSGLAPIQRAGGWSDDEDEESSPNIVRPYEIDGQRVAWCVSPSSPERTFGYAARVVSPGTYTWEPALIQSVNAPEVGAATERFAFTIR
jgi:hypothetical protein